LARLACLSAQCHLPYRQYNIMRVENRRVMRESGQQCPMNPVDTPVSFSRPVSPLSFVPGFTLLELAVVLLIIGLVLAIAMPHFGAFQGAELRSEAHRLAARSHYLYEEAGAQKVLLRLNLDLNNSTYFVTRLDPFAAEPSFRPESGPAGGLVTMPADVRLRDVWIEGGGLFRSGIVPCQFYPAGIVDAAVIHLFDRKGDVMTVGIDPFNGAVAIISGDLSPAALEKETRK
jgi:prepilin-type N-terminal cleavage/methylation domain-containing protein